ncbi:hypothetical protein [Anabaena azotica]|uniref:hypothetical protein n=1 Tax=Anabaena azotica TaxID=197653 RepID=UPI0039A4A24B
MSKNFTSNSDKMLCDLSEAEQEIIIAGQSENIPVQANLFLQNTNIQTEADNKLNLGSDSSSQKTKYNLSQSTIGFSVSFILPNISSVMNNRGNLLPNILRQIDTYLFR